MKYVFYTIFFGAAAILGAVIVCRPELLAGNVFLRGFINHELVNILSVIVTVTAASGANLHLSFNRAEEALGREGLFQSARREVTKSVMILLVAFGATIVTLIFRSYWLDHETVLATFNAACLMILLLNVLVLIDLTTAIFELHPFIRGDGDG